MRNFQYFDLFLFGSSILLLLLGLLMVFSTTNEDNGLTLLMRQGIFAATGLAGMFALTFYDYRNMRKITPWIYLSIVILLLLVYFVGPVVRGSARWVDLGFFRLQPAEFAKLAMVVVMAKFLDVQGERLRNFRYVVLSAIYLAIPMVLILIEPDLGSSLIVFAVWFGLLMFSKINKKHLAILIVVLLALAVLSWFFILHDYQKDRVYTFLDPERDPQGQGYNVLQSIIAVGSGELWGRGVGRGLQSQLDFLPERQTDFIFASTAEELGFIGSVVILGLYFVLFMRLIKTCRGARDNFGMYLSLGVFIMLLSQVVINMGMNIGILPVTGIPLPLLSLGGSSMITTLLSLGIVQSVVARQKAVRFGI
ncbi:MAG: rod shape-determining protein RodA [Candidatus Doudnabacteria bacterium]|nr:rod shape-determining protein RodA [Candidatus Doudnabacteria bacterium]